MKVTSIHYFDHMESARNPDPPFRSGDAGFVWFDEENEAQTDHRVAISGNSLHALHGHGVVDLLNDLALVSGPIGEGKDAVLTPGAVDEASGIFYDADRMTYGGVHDLLVTRHGEIEYRLVVDNREYQRTLSKLQFLSTTAARHGHGLRLRL